MNLENSDCGDQPCSGCSHLENSTSSSAFSKGAYRKLEVQEASFAIEYLRSACQGVIPNSLRQRIGESDLIQDALLNATQSIAQFRGSTVDSFRCWLRGIYLSRLKNLIRAHITSQKRSVRREELRIDDSIVDEGAYSRDVINEETAMLEAQIMNQSFQQLSASDQQILELHSRRGISFDKVAMMLGVSEGSVRKRYTRAIHRWRKLVQKASRNCL